ncbi:MAG: hypothetical protein K2Q25_14330 [Mycobacteriaceae bacterium]|nr:hypothetical protein [Mycobacteriaceae bacterium]
MADYLQVCAVIVALTEAALIAGAVVDGIGGDVGVSLLQGFAGGVEAAGVAYYFEPLGLAKEKIDAITARIDICKNATGLGDPLPMAKGGLLLLALVAGLVEAVLMFNGFGTPERGKDFQRDSGHFSGHIADLLSGASAAAWDGDGAEKYTRRNADQGTHVQWMAEADHAVFAALRHQADEVEAVRLELAGIMAGLAAATLPAIKMFRECIEDRDMALFGYDCANLMSAARYWRLAWAWAWALVGFVTAVVSAAVGGVVYLLYHLMDEVAPRTKHRLQRARDSYRQIITAASARMRTAAGGSAVRMPPAAVSTAGAFGDFASGVADATPRHTFSRAWDQPDSAATGTPAAAHVRMDRPFYPVSPVGAGNGRSPLSRPGPSPSGRPTVNHDRSAEEARLGDETAPVGVVPAAGSTSAGAAAKPWAELGGAVRVGG